MYLGCIFEGILVHRIIFFSFIPFHVFFFRQESQITEWTCPLLSFLKKKSRQVNFEFPLENVDFKSQEKFFVDVKLKSKCQGSENHKHLEKIENILLYNSTFKVDLVQRKRPNLKWENVDLDTEIDFSNKPRLSLKQIYQIENQGPSPTKGAFINHVAMKRQKRNRKVAKK